MTPQNPQSDNERIPHGRRASGGPFWMRSVRFAGLQRIARMVAEHPRGIRAGELNRQVLEQNLYRTERGSPAKSTLYHCRSTLLNLGILERHQRILSVARSNPIVTRLLDAPLPDDGLLSPVARQAFADLVLQNQDCLSRFFGLFLTSDNPVSAEEFAMAAHPVIWTQRSQTDAPRTIDLHSVARGTSVYLTSPVAIRSVLYGVRYWARDDLQVIDEYFETGRGSVMYPVRLNTSEQDALAVMSQILDLPADASDWTTTSVNALLRSVCELRQYRVSTLFDAIRAMLTRYPSHIVLIPTIPNFAAISATSRNREAFELRGYFTDTQGRLISHIRFHNSLRGLKHG